MSHNHPGGHGDGAPEDDTDDAPARTTAEEIDAKVAADIERELERRGLDADTDTEVVQRDAGVRLRTNVQAGSASERAEVTLETNARDMADLVTQLDSHRQVVTDELSNAIDDAKAANRDDGGDE